jgi:hypothetical protein
MLGLTGVTSSQPAQTRALLGRQPRLFVFISLHWSFWPSVLPSRIVRKKKRNVPEKATVNIPLSSSGCPIRSCRQGLVTQYIQILHAKMCSMPVFSLHRPISIPQGAMKVLILGGRCQNTAESPTCGGNFCGEIGTRGACYPREENTCTVLVYHSTKNAVALIALQCFVILVIPCVAPPSAHSYLFSTHHIFSECSCSVRHGPL